MKAARQTRPNAPDGIGVGDINAVKFNRSAVWLQLARDLFDQGGFARAIRADQRVDLAFSQVERHVIGRLQSTETFA